MADAGRNPDDYCYRHPDRLSFVLCERCGRTICLECQRHTGGRVLCPDDATEERPVIPTRAQRFTNRNRRRVRTVASRIPTELPVVSYTLMGILALSFLGDLFSGGALYNLMIYAPPLEYVRPWTLITGNFAMTGDGYGLISLLGAVLTLLVFGPQIERVAGHRKFGLLILISAAAGTLLAVLFNGLVWGPSGGFLGLLGAFLLYARRARVSMVWLYLILAINVLSVVVPDSRSLLWQTAFGGLATGFALAYVHMFEGANRRAKQLRRGLIIAGVVLISLTIVKIIAFYVVFIRAGAA